MLIVGNANYETLSTTVACQGFPNLCGLNALIPTMHTIMGEPLISQNDRYSQLRTVRYTLRIRICRNRLST